MVRLNPEDRQILATLALLGAPIIIAVGLILWWVL